MFELVVGKTEAFFDADAFEVEVDVVEAGGLDVKEIRELVVEAVTRPAVAKKQLHALVSAEPAVVPTHDGIG